MNDRLTDREIIRLHQMKSSGASDSMIADTLGISLQSVYDHIRLRVGYQPEVYQKIGKLPQFPNTNRMSIYEASILLPGWPSRDKTYRLYRSGILKAKKTVSGSDRLHLTCTLSQVKDCAARMLSGPGIYISQTTLTVLAPALIPRIREYGRRLKYWPSRKGIFYPMPVATQAAIDYQLELSIPAWLIHRAVTILDRVQTATI